MKDWEAWHTGYDNESALAERLQIVQKQIRNCLPRTLSEPFQILNLCAGDGRDLIGALAGYAFTDLVHGRLIELDSNLAEKARRDIQQAELAGLEVVTGDASLTDAYKGAVPADLVTLCGIFGNISNEDITQTINTLPALCKPEAHVIWTRNRREPDFTPTISSLFKDNNFSEIDFFSSQDPSRKIAVGLNQFTGETKTLPKGISLFTFQDRQ